MNSFADLAIIVRPRGAAEQRVPCPQCDRGAGDDALGVNIETGRLTLNRSLSHQLLEMLPPVERRHLVSQS